MDSEAPASRSRRSPAASTGKESPTAPPGHHRVVADLELDQLRQVGLADRCDILGSSESAEAQHQGHYQDETGAGSRLTRNMEHLLSRI